MENILLLRCLQINISIQWNPNQNSSSHFCRNWQVDTKFCLSRQKNQEQFFKIVKEEESWKTYITLFKT